MLNYEQSGGVKDKKVGFYRKKTLFCLEVLEKVPIFALYNNNECARKPSTNDENNRNVNVFLNYE